MLDKSNRSIYCAFIALTGMFLLWAASSSAEDKEAESIFKYKEALAITDMQENNLRDILSKLQGYLAAKTEELNRHKAELNKMIADKADLDTIRTELWAIARIQADSTYEDIASVRAIEKELTADQMLKWRGMQADFRKGMQQPKPAPVALVEENELQGRGQAN